MNRCDRAGKRAGYGRNASFSYRVDHAGCGAMPGVEEIIIQAIDSRQIEGYLKILNSFSGSLSIVN